MSIHNIAAVGFEQAAKVYEEARPSYPAEAIEHVRTLCSTKPDVIVDLGAGTGKLTRLLTAFDAKEIIAIEPVAAMRESLQTISTITRILDGSAEKIPLDDNSVDILFCAQAFHWFANHQALAEMNRVLKPNGLLVLIWNQADPNRCQWYVEITDAVDRLREKGTPQYRMMEWKQAFENQTYFSPLKHLSFSNVQRLNQDMIIKRIQSTSFISALPDDRRKIVLDEFRQKFQTLDELRDKNEIDVFHLTDVYSCSALKLSSS